jgi:predicted RNA-binding Zn-ribbon protein involved in translation (DUF1610 family)
VTKIPFNLVDREDLFPLCPHCGKELTEIHRKSKGSGLIVGRNSVFFCPHCKKVLGFGQCRMA